MATTIVLKHSDTAGFKPSAAELVAGELALNTTDATLYAKTPAGAVVQLNTAQSNGTFSPVFIGATTNPVCTYTSNTGGQWCRIGSLMFVTARLVVATVPTAGSGALRVSLAGLPLPRSGCKASGAVGISANFASSTPASAYLAGSSNYLQLMTPFAEGLPLGRVQCDSLQGDCDLAFTIIYEVA